MKNIKNKKGFAMLYVVVLVGLSVMTMTLYLSWLSVFSIRNKNEKSDSNMAQDLADTCSENALMAIWNDVNTSGTVNRNNFSNGTCSYEIIILTGENREIRAIGKVGNVIRKNKISVDQVNAKVNVSSWREVGDFN